MHMLRHHDKVVQEVVPFCSVVQQGFQKQISVSTNLKQSSPLIGRRRDQKGPGMRDTWRNAHDARFYRADLSG